VQPQITRFQAAIGLVVGAVALALSGRHAAVGVLVAAGAGLLVSTAVVVRYQTRAPRSRHSALERFNAAFVLSCQLALVIASIVSLVEAGGGITRSSVVGLIGVFVVVLWQTIATSTVVDAYFVLPALSGRDGGPPMWESDALGNARRRRGEVTRIWLLNRALTYLLVRLDLAALALVIVVEISKIPNKASLGPVVGAFGGGFIAFMSIGGPRAPLAAAFQFVVNPQAYVGDWVAGTDSSGMRVSGLVVDVSLDGLGVDISDMRTVLPLNGVRKLDLAARPVDDAWAARAFERLGFGDPDQMSAQRKVESPLAERPATRSARQPAGGPARVAVAEGLAREPFKTDLRLGGVAVARWLGQVLEGEPNAAHQALAQLATGRGARAWTVNFDRFIEKADPSLRVLA
jgi:hypothetical protein